MEKHHEESIANLVRAMEKDDAILALILGGSLAHGFAQSDSDIDVTLVVSAEDYARRSREGKLHYNNRELCTYEGGYIDGKYADRGFLESVAERGSDAARYAFHQNRVLFSRVPGLADLLARIVSFPEEDKAERIGRFAAQLLAWRWYYGEGLRREDAYVATLAAQKLALFGGRIVLTVNRMLFPYHKWFRRVLATAPRQPAGFEAALDGLFRRPTREFVHEYVLALFAFAGVDFEAADAAWPTRFIKDTETRWLSGEPAIDDI